MGNAVYKFEFSDNDKPNIKTEYRFEIGETDQESAENIKKIITTYSLLKDTGSRSINLKITSPDTYILPENINDKITTLASAFHKNGVFINQLNIELENLPETYKNDLKCLIQTVFDNGNATSDYCIGYSIV